ncbi:DUF4350 domain-containing protein [Lacisediminihabitans profunda]|uniref:DUF4350 domain-containing protein n=1 Tax=Lacisediminihabitans profunda TaxID=2594790 RepID=A0A5C8ULV2_9MICO|nr:DUF4350 domain-containing protein [Lacisediminihabitans profunda]TXN28781.1 DUF4350 domain-containing protein [Lacisediminihabitans profunda]
MTATPSTATSTTPTIRRATRRSLFWILAATFLVLVAIIGIALTGSALSRGTEFSATNPGPIGSMAVAEVLRQQGVDVRVAGSFGSAKSALVARPGSTLFLYDSGDFLDDTRLTEIAGLARDVVVLTPGFAQLRAVAPQVAQAGTVKRKVLRSDCALAAVAKAESVTGAGRGYRVTGTGTVATRCLGSGSRVFSLIRLERGAHTITVLGTTDALRNEHVAERGNAALVLNLLGANPRLVWYLPTIDDSAAADAPSIAELTPVWVSSVMALLVIVAIAAAFWRGRRMGPLVIENLPVTVRASETMEGRARLYQRGGARLRALDSLRVGTIARVAAQCGLPRLATVDDVIAAASAVTGSDPRQLRSLLLDDTPRTDRELVRLSDRLLELERSVARSIRPA